jgi:hypothetical protein
MSRFTNPVLTPKELADALAAAREDDVAALASVETAKVEYEAALLSATPDQLKAFDEARSAAQRLADVSRARIADLSRRHAAATDPALIAAQKKRRAAAIKKADAAKEFMVAEYPKAAETLRTVLRNLAEAELAIREANRDATGDPLLQGSEAFRSIPVQWKEILSDTPVLLWAGAGNPNIPLPEHLQAQVQPGPQKGSPEYARNVRLHGEVGANSLAARGTLQTSQFHSIDVVRGTFRRKEVLPDVPGWNALELAGALTIPAIFAGDAPYFEKVEGIYDPASVIEELDKPRRTRPAQPERVPVVEFV